MDDKHIKDALQSIAQQHIGDDMNMWPKIDSEIRRMNRRSRLMPHTRLGWVMVLLMVFITAGATVYAVDRLLRTGDPGLEAVDNANMITHFNETRQIGDFAITLLYAYADANRISVAYQAEIEMPADSDITYNFTQGVLSDDKGHIFEPMFGGGGGGGGGSESNPTVQLMFMSEGSYDASVIEESPEELNLRLELAIGSFRIEPMGGSGGGFGGGGSGGGSNDATAEPMTGVGTILVPTGDEIASTTFEFTIPFNPGRVMDTPQTVTANGIDMTLQRVVVTPSLARLEICYDPPTTAEAGQNWNLMSRLHIGGELVDEQNGMMIADLMRVYSAEPVAPERCRDYIIQQSLVDHEGEWTLAIDRLILQGSADRDMIHEIVVNEYGIIPYPQPDGGFGYGPAEGMGYEEFMAIMDRVTAEQMQQVDGAWVFTFNLP